MTDDTLIHFDGLTKLAEKAAAFHSAAFDGGLEYERFGVCTPDLVALAQHYSVSAVEAASANEKSVMHALVFSFLAGFDLGYQARLEIETRELVQDDPTQPYDQEQDG